MVFHLDIAAFVDKLYRVLDQVINHLMHQIRVSADHNFIHIQPEDVQVFGFNGLLKAKNHLTYNVVQVKLRRIEFHLSRFNLGQIQH